MIYVVDCVLPPFLRHKLRKASYIPFLFFSLHLLLYLIYLTSSPTPQLPFHPSTIETPITSTPHITPIMSSNLNSGYTGQDNTSATHNTSENQGGLVDTIKSYIPGLSPTASRDQQSGTHDATAEPAFGAAVNPNASHSHTGTGSSAYGSSTTSGPHSSDLSNRADPRVDSDNSRLGSSNTSGLGSNTSGLGSESTGYGSSNTGLGSSGALGSSSTGYGSSTTSGPHSSSLANQADPRVDSDNSRLGSSNTSGLGSSGALGSESTGYGSSNTGLGSSGALGSPSTGYGSSSTTGPHSSSLANQADPRVDSDNSRLGSSNTSGLGSSSTGYGSSSTTSGPHSSNLANKADPRVDSDNSRLGSSSTSGFGSSHTGGSALSGGSERDGFTPAPTLNPHDEERAKVVAARATGGASGPYDGGLKTDQGYDGSSGLRDGRVGESSGLGSTGAGIGYESGRGSGVGSVVGPDSSRGAGYGSGAGLDSTRESGVGSGVGLGSTRESGVGLGSNSRDGRDSLAGRDGDRPSEFNSDKTDRATAGLSEGATAEESQASATPRHEAEKGSSKRENKDAIPTAGGIKLGEKHWGESDIVPADPGARNERENVSSASGQPDR
jgi:hypothetical protein